MSLPAFDLCLYLALSRLDRRCLGLGRFILHPSQANSIASVLAKHSAMSDNSSHQALLPQGGRHAAALTSDELDLGGLSWKGAGTELTPTAQLSSSWQVHGDWRLASSSDPSLSELCQYWYNAGWQQCFSQCANQCCCPYQAIPGAHALPAASPQFPLLANPTVSLAGYAAQDASWPQHGQLPTPPESLVQSPAPADSWWGSTDGRKGRSGTGSDHDHRNSATCRCGYDQLLMEAFRSSPGKPLSMGDICRWFKTYTHIPRSKKESTWRTGIRRNLNSCKTSAKYQSEGEKWVMKDTALCEDGMLDGEWGTA